MEEKKQLDEGASGSEEKVTPGSALLGRLIWAMSGPVLLLSLLVPVSRDPKWMSQWDIAYAANLLLMIWGRYLEQKSGHGGTLYGETSTWSHFRKYVVKLLVVGGGLWICTKLAVSR